MFDRKWTTTTGSEYRVRSTAEAFENDNSGKGCSLLEYNSEYGWVRIDPADAGVVLFDRLAQILDEAGSEEGA